MRTTSNLAPIAVIGAALLFACSSSSGTTGGTTSGDAGGGSGGGGTCNASIHSCTDACDGCTLLTQAQVTTAFGTAVGAGVPSSGNCSWTYTDPKDAFSGFDVVLDTRIDYATFQDLCHPGTNAGNIVTPVSGVGDDACTVGAGTAARPILTFARGCWGYQIGVNTAGAFRTQLTDDQILGAEKALALEALPNL